MDFRPLEAWLRLSTCLGIVLATTFGAADRVRASTPDDEIRKVEINLFVVDVFDIDSAEQSVVIDFLLAARWHDASLVGGALERRVLNAEGHWTPILQVTNGRNLRRSMGSLLEVEPDGTVTYRQRFVGTLSSRMDVADFPFDHHAIQIRIVAGSLEPIELEPNHAASGLADLLTVPDWDVEGGRVFKDSFQAAGRVLPSVVFEFEVHRHTGYYVGKVMLPLVLIVFMSWSVFWIDPSQFAPQLSTATASMLTLIAYRFALQNLLPKISYFTRMDTFITGSTLLVFLALAQAVTTSRLAHGPNRAVAVRIEVICRVVFPALFVALVVYAFWL